MTVDLVRVGPDKDKVTALVHGLTGATSDVAPGILHRDVPRQEAAEFKSKAEAAGAVVRLIDGDARDLLGDARRPRSTRGVESSASQRETPTINKRRLARKMHVSMPGGVSAERPY